MGEKFSYDSLPYPSYTFPQTRPDRLSTIGRYFGIDTALPTSCRMLEIGCGDGTNLISFGYCHPESEFLGIDLAQNHIDAGRKAAKEVGVNNVQLEYADITQKTFDDLGAFDFIIAHGFMSWVPPFVRDHMLRLYSECLTPNGIGYISYNAYPGFHLREIARGMMQFHSRHLEDPLDRVEHAKMILGFVHQSLPDEHLHAKLLERELKEVYERSTSNVFHDDLSDFNQAYYFHEFEGLIAGYDLQFVSESDIGSSTILGFSEDVQKGLMAIGQDHSRREQYIDFIKLRRFRSSLVCRKTVNVDRTPDPAIVREFRISASLRSDGAERSLFDTSTVTFRGEKDETVQMNHPLTKIAIDELGRRWVHSVPYSELYEVSKGRLEAEGFSIAEDDERKLNSFLLQMFQVELVHFHRFEPRIAATVDEYPRVSDFARWQVEHGCDAVSTLTGMNLAPESDLVRLMIKLCDGSRTVEDIANELRDAVDLEANEKEDFNERAAEIVEFSLNELLRAGLLTY